MRQAKMVLPRIKIMDRFQKMTTKNSENNTVVILVSDLNKGKELSSIFKKVGVHPYVCTKLSQFWEEANKEAPHLAIVDIRMMSEGDLLLKNHPRVKSGETSLVFSYDSSTSPLLYSTFEVFNLGLINLELSLIGQIKSILKRFNTFKDLELSARASKKSEDKLDSKISKIIGTTESLKEKDFYSSYLKSLLGRFESERKAEDFFVATARVLSSVKEVKAFTFLELSPSGQKLVSPKFRFEKYREIPSLWLGKVCETGIEFFAQNMASQICLELMGGELMSLLVRGKKDDPDLMLFLRLESEEFLSLFDWESLERYLSGYYSYFKLKSLNPDMDSTSFNNSWDLFDRLDEMKFGSIPESRVEGGFDSDALIGINFSSLHKKVFDTKECRFYWKSFYQNFLNGLGNLRSLDASLFSVDPKLTVLLLNKDTLEKSLIEIKSYTSRFHYWRYFEDTDIVLSSDLKPEIRVVPMSPTAIESLREDEFILSLEEKLEKEKSEQGKSKSIIINGPDQTM